MNKTQERPKYQVTCSKHCCLENDAGSYKAGKKLATDHRKNVRCSGSIVVATVDRNTGHFSAILSL